MKIILNAILLCKVRSLLFIVFFSFNSFCFGSNQSKLSNINLYETATHVLGQANSWIGKTDNEFRLESTQTSEYAQHFQFVQLHQGIKVYGAFFKINIALNGKVLSTFNNFKPIHTSLPLKWLGKLPALDSCRLYLNLDKFELVKYLQIKNDKGEFVEQLFSSTGELIYFKPLDLMVKKDTLISTKVFNPDPLTSAQKIYNQDGLWNNANGVNTTQLNGELKSFSTTLTFQNDTFYPYSPYIIIKDIESPTQTIFTSTNPSFSFNRSQSQFREFNVLYHIESYRKYLKSIQIPLTDMQAILADPTAYAGQDQSRFSYSSVNPSLYFGTGGVPDAEDADVIIHEYTHGINYFLAPNTVDGNERLAVEEANCDFMACQYSKAISNYNWRWVFNWDGHNQYWSGRDANSSNVYPKDLSTDFYTSSLIWSSMLNDLSDDLGREIITRMLFNSIYSYANNMSMQDAANLLVQSDSILFGNAHFNILKPRLVQRGFFVTGIESHQSLNSGIEIINSQGFANGSSKLMIQNTRGEKFDYQLLDLKGTLICQSDEENNAHQISPENLPLGMYIIRIFNQYGEQASSKLLRLN